jgi:predicted transcriptional regulator
MDYNLLDINYRFTRQKSHAVLVPVMLHPTGKRILSVLSQHSAGVFDKDFSRDITDAQAWEITYHLKELSQDHFIIALESGAYALTSKGRRYLAEHPEVDRQ